MSPADQWLRFATLARQLSEVVLPRFSHRFSPQRFTLPQQAACVLLKAYRQLDWRGIEALLELSPALRHALKLTRAPDFSTLWRFAQRWMDARCLGRVLTEWLRRLGLAPIQVAVDSTGLDPGRTSRYFVARRRQQGHRKRYVKLSLSVVVGRLVAASVVAASVVERQNGITPVAGRNRPTRRGTGTVLPMPATTPNGYISGVGTSGAFAVGFRRRCIGPTARRAATGARA